MNKRLPKINNDRDAELLLEQDLTDYLNKENFTPMTFEFEPKDKVITFRVSEKLLKAIKKSAEKRGISYQKWLRETVESSLIDY
ncbi:CopG family antitoxin [Geminocystis sp. CENA526]|uniref:CopG family antitoxin n=1 Tax=Geminocystis sp. CENA526 TaxID=1355871 RepID=UPI003D6ECB96